MACVILTAGAQPEIVPSSEANKNWLGADTPLAVTTKPAPLLNTVPVGVPRPSPVNAGTLTTSGTTWASPSSRSETPVPLSANQKGPVGLNDRPHGLTKLASVTRARPGTSEARLMTLK